MDYNNIGVTRLSKAVMSYDMQRQKTLAENIANIDTPRYDARDLNKVNFANLAAAEANRLEMRATGPKHMPGINTSGGPYRSEEDRKTFETTPVRNNVVLEEQMAKINETGLSYQMASSIYRKMGSLFKIAIGTNR